MGNKMCVRKKLWTERENFNYNFEFGCSLKGSMSKTGIDLYAKVTKAIRI